MKRKRRESKESESIIYTPELKLKLIRLCVCESDRYLAATSESEFWQYLTPLFKQSIGYHGGGGDVRRKAISMIMERKGVLETRKKLSGVVESASTDLDQAVDGYVDRNY